MAHWHQSSWLRLRVGARWADWMGCHWASGALGVTEAGHRMRMAQMALSCLLAQLPLVAEGEAVAWRTEIDPSPVVRTSLEAWGEQNVAVRQMGWLLVPNWLVPEAGGLTGRRCRSLPGKGWSVAPPTAPGPGVWTVPLRALCPQVSFAQPQLPAATGQGSWARRWWLGSVDPEPRWVVRRHLPLQTSAAPEPRCGTAGTPDSCPRPGSVGER